MVIAEYDPLRDEGLAYAHKLKEAGVKVTTSIHPMMHGYINFVVRLKEAQTSVQEIAHFTKEVTAS